VLLGACPPAFSGFLPPKPINLSAAELQLHLTNALILAQKLEESGCVADSGLLKKLGKFQEAGSSYQAFSSSEVTSLMRDVQKPMEGNGRCDGSLRSVASETQTRIVRTERSLQVIDQQFSQFASTAVPIIDLPSFKVEKIGCTALINKFLDKLALTSKASQSATNDLKTSISDVRSRLTAFKAANNSRADDCGSLSVTEMLAPVAAGGIAPAPASGARGAAGYSGSAKNGLSDVTGVEEDARKRAALAATGGSSRASRPGFANAGTGKPGAPPDRSTITRSRPGPRGEKAAILESFERTLDAAPPTGGAGAKPVPEVPESSVGSLIWNMPSDPGKMDLELKEAAGRAGTAPGRSPASVSATALPEGTPENLLASNPQLQPLPVAGDGAVKPIPGLPEANLQGGEKASLALAGAETSLFELVHSRYRKTDMFRALRP
jgi:hypothetical protein